MKRIFKFIPVALAAVALSSCSSDDLFGSLSSKTDGLKTLEVTVEQLNDGTITRMANLGEGNGVIWQAGDKIAVYDDQLFIYDPYEFDEKAKSFVLQKNEAELLDAPKYALFPYAYFDPDKGCTHWERANDKVWAQAIIPNQMKYGWDSEATNVNTPYVTADGKAAYVSLLPMWGTATKDGDKTSVSLHYMTAILKVTLTNAMGNRNYLYVRGFKNIAGTEYAQLNGFFRADLSTTGRIPVTSAALTGQYVAPTKDDNYIEIDISNINKATSVIYIPVPAGHYGMLDVWATAGQVADPGNSATAIAAADKIYQFIDKDFEVKFYGSMLKKTYDVDGSSVLKINNLLIANKEEAQDELVLDCAGAGAAATDVDAGGEAVHLPNMAAGSVELKLKDITTGALTFDGSEFSKKFILNLTDCHQPITIDLPNADVVLAGSFGDKNVTVLNANSLTFGDETVPEAPATTTTQNFGDIDIKAEVKGVVTVAQYAKIKSSTDAGGNIMLPANHRSTGIEINGVAGNINVNASAITPATTVNVAGTTGAINTPADASTVTVSGVAGAITMTGTGACTVSGQATSITNTTGDVTIEGAPIYVDDAVKVGTVSTSGNVTVDLSAEGAAIGTSVTFNKTANFNLTQGYVKAIAVGADNVTVSVNLASEAKYASILTVPADAATNRKVRFTNASIWNGKKVGDGIPNSAAAVKAALVTDWEAYVGPSIYTATAFAQKVTGDIGAALTVYNDITLTGNTFTAAGELSAAFTGNKSLKSVDANPVITGLNLGTVAKNTTTGFGLFKTAVGGSIANLTFNGISIATHNDGGCSNIGGLIGIATGTAAIAINNVALTGTNTITGTRLAENIGGIIGQIAGGANAITLTDVNVAGLTITGYQALGGLVGYVKDGAKATFARSGAGTNVDPYKYNTVSDLKFTMLTSGKDIDANYAKVGGFIGYTDNAAANVANVVLFSDKFVTSGNAVAERTNTVYTVTNADAVANAMVYPVLDGSTVLRRQIVKGQYLIGFTDSDTKDVHKVTANEAVWTNFGKVASNEVPAKNATCLEYIKNF